MLSQNPPQNPERFIFKVSKESVTQTADMFCGVAPLDNSPAICTTEAQTVPVMSVTSIPSSFDACYKVTKDKEASQTLGYICGKEEQVWNYLVDTTKAMYPPHGSAPHD